MEADQYWNFFEDILPPEVTMMVFSHFSLEDVVYVSLVCKTWNTYFDTKHIWKQIYELNFGELAETNNEEKGRKRTKVRFATESFLDSVDNRVLVQDLPKFKWKRLFFIMASAMKWKNHFKRMTTMFTYRDQQNGPQYLHALVVGRHHLIIRSKLVVAIDLKTAAKIVARNSSPVSYYSPHSFLTPDSWKQTLVAINFKDKSDATTMPDDFNTYKWSAVKIAMDGNGKYMTETSPSVLWDPTVHMNADKNPPIQFVKMTQFYPDVSMNSKYVVGVHNNQVMRNAEIIDLSKTCAHCGWLVYDNKTKRYFPKTTTTACANNCALTPLGYSYVAGYALKHNPDKIYELHFGELDESTVDLATKFKWKRLFFIMASAMKWKNHFQRMSTMFTYRDPPIAGFRTEISSIIVGRYHLIIRAKLVMAIDLKTAAKIVARNSSPVSFYSSFNFFPDTKWKQTLATIDFKDKSDEATMYNILYDYKYSYITVTMDGNGKYLADTSPPTLWDPAVHMNTDKNPPIQFVKWSQTYRNASLNSKYIVGINNTNFNRKAEIIDLNKSCAHCGWRVYNDKKKTYEVESTTECADSCALTPLGYWYIAGYALKHNPDKVVLVREDQMDIWMNGKVVEEIKFAKQIRSIVLFSDHLTTVDGVTRHWLTYTTPDTTTFIDLNHLSCKYSIPKIDSITWVSKKNKAILVSDNKATVFDVELRKWQAKIKCKSAIKAMCFNSTGHLLFIADTTEIHAYQWETGHLIASMPHECGTEVKSLHLGLDQVFCIVSQRGYVYKRVMRCDV